MLYEENTIQLKEFIQNIHSMISFMDETDEDTRVGFVRYCSHRKKFDSVHHTHEGMGLPLNEKNLSDLPWYKRDCYISRRSTETVDEGFHIHTSPIVTDKEFLGILTIHTREISDKKRNLYRSAENLLSNYYAAITTDQEATDTLQKNFSTLSILDLVTKISQIIIATDSIDDISNKLYREMKRYFGECAIGIAVNSHKEMKLTQCFYYEYDKKLDFDDIPYSRGSGSKLLQAVLTEREGTYEYMMEKRDDVIVGQFPRASYFTPLIMNGRVLGAFTYQTFERDTFSEMELDLCRKLIPFMTITLNNTLQNNALLETNTKLKYLSSYDSLTELYNRRYFYEVFEKIYKRAFLKKKESHLVLFDLDNFKGVNDNFSHTEGDAAIVKITYLIKKEFSGSASVLGRYGGDEFLAGVVDITTEDLILKLKRLREDVLSLEIPCDREGTMVGVSMGIIRLDILVPLREAFHIADRCLYEAKSHDEGIALSSISDFHREPSKEEITYEI